MRHADDGALANARNRIEHFLDLLRIDVEAAGDDQVLGAADDGHAALCVDGANIAGDEPAVCGEVLARLLRHAPVALEDIGALHLENARLLAADAHRHAGQREAHRARHARAVIGVGGDHAGLGHAIAFEDGVARARGEFRVRFGQQRGRAGNEQPHVARRFPREGRLGEEARVEGRNAHHQGRLRHRGDHRLHVELVEPEHSMRRRETPC